jgi:hypothetical protein
MPEIPRVSTPISEAAAADELVHALEAQGETPNQAQAALLLAQLIFEGAIVACKNHNVGNITTTSDASKDFFRPIWFDLADPEIPALKPADKAKIVALHEQMVKGKAPRAFRSYDDFTAGFHDYVWELIHQFPDIIAAARRGDADAMAAAVKKHYTPDAPSSLPATLASISAAVLARGRFAQLPPKASPAQTPASEPGCSSSRS